MKTRILTLCALAIFAFAWGQTYKIEVVDNVFIYTPSDGDQILRQPSSRIFANTLSNGNVSIRMTTNDPAGVAFDGRFNGLPYTSYRSGAGTTYATAAALQTWFDANTGIGEGSAGTDNQNISGSGLAGTVLTIGIENGTNEDVDLASLAGGISDVNVITPEQFGAVGNGITDDVLALQAMFDFMRDNNSVKYKVKLSHTVYLISAPLNIHDENYGATIEGSGLSPAGMSKIISTDNTTHILRVWHQAVAISNVRFDYQTKATNVNAIALLLKMSDITTGSGTVNDYVNNTDATVEDCVFVNAYTGIEVWGRSNMFRNNVFSVVQRGMVFKQLNTEGKYGGAARSYKIYGNEIHGSLPVVNETSALVVNETENGWGFHISHNFSDAFTSLFIGELLASKVTNNMCYNMNAYGIYATNIDDTQIIDNALNNAQLYGNDPPFQPPYSMKGGIFASGVISNSTISTNIFGDMEGNVIKANGIINTQISNNKIGKWGLNGTNLQAFLFDTAPGLSSDVTMSGNTFNQSNPLATYVFKTSSTDNAIMYAADNLILTDNAKVSIYQRVVEYYDIEQGFRRAIESGEDISSPAIDCFSQTGIYITSTGVLGTPFNASKAVLRVENIDGVVTRKFNIVGPNIAGGFVQQISGATEGNWRKIQTSANGTSFPTVALMVGEYFYRTDLSKPYLYNGTKWVDFIPTDFDPAGTVNYDDSTLVAATVQNASDITELRASTQTISSARNLVAADIYNTVECTVSATLTITLNFTAMAIGQEVNLTTLGTTLTVTAAASVTLNNIVSGSETVGSDSFSGTVLKKVGANSYAVFND